QGRRQDVAVSCAPAGSAVPVGGRPRLTQPWHTSTADTAGAHEPRTPRLRAAIERRTSVRTVRTALVGCGKVGQTHAAALRALPESEFVAACDSDPARAAALAGRYGVRAYADVG